MSRPVTCPKNRISTAVRFAPDIYEALLIAAKERDVSMTWLVNRAVADFLPRLLPLNEITLTRPQPEPPKADQR